MGFILSIFIAVISSRFLLDYLSKTRPEPSPLPPWARFWRMGSKNGGKPGRNGRRGPWTTGRARRGQDHGPGPRARTTGQDHGPGPRARTTGQGIRAPVARVPGPGPRAPVARPGRQDDLGADHGARTTARGSHFLLDTNPGPGPRVGAFPGVRGAFYLGQVLDVFGLRPGMAGRTFRAGVQAARPAGVYWIERQTKKAPARRPGPSGRGREA